MDTHLNYEISDGKLSETPKDDPYHAAGAIKDTDVDYVFNNVGFSTTSGLYSLSIGSDVREPYFISFNKHIIIGHIATRFSYRW